MENISTNVRGRRILVIHHAVIHRLTIRRARKTNILNGKKISTREASIRIGRTRGGGMIGILGGGMGKAGIIGDEVGERRRNTF